MSDDKENRCCFCGEECSFHSQCCGRCMRRTSMMDPRDIVHWESGPPYCESPPSPSPEITIDEIISYIEKLSEHDRLEIIGRFCSFCGILQNLGCQCEERK